MNIPDDQLPLIIRALEHYADYLKATQRDDRFFREIVDRMKRKEPEQQHTGPARRKRRA